MRPTTSASLPGSAGLESMRTAIRSALGLLEGPDKVRWRRVLYLQVFSSFLDLAGVALIGLVAIVATKAAQGSTEDTGRLAELTDLAGSPTTLVIVVCSAATLLFLAKSMTSALVLRKLYGHLATFHYNASQRMLATLFSRPQSTLDRWTSQDAAYAITQGASSATISLLGSFAILRGEFLLLTMMGTFLLIVEPITTLTALIFFVAIGVVVQRILSGRSARQGGRLAHSAIGANQAIQEGMACYRELLVLGRREQYVDQTVGRLQMGASARAEGAYIAQLPRLVYESALVVGAVALAGTKFLFSTKEEAVTALVIFLAAGARLMPSLMRVNGQLIIMRSAAAQAQKAFDLMDDLTSEGASPSEPILPTRVVDRDTFSPDLRLADLTFTYPGAKSPALDQVSVSLEAGKVLAVVGPTGSGKSTLADLILGVRRTDEGSIAIGGFGPGEISRGCPGLLAYVPQAVALVNGTIRDNVALAVLPKDVDDDEVWRALGDAHLVDVIKSLPGGLDAPVGERGMMLSGGQRQRLGLARALYTNPMLLVLDEATSALDAETEASIAATLRELRGRVTCVIIAHRLSTIRDADLILGLEQGHVVLSGTFDDVIQSDANFQRQAYLQGLVSSMSFVE